MTFESQASFMTSKSQASFMTSESQASFMTYQKVRHPRPLKKINSNLNSVTFQFENYLYFFFTFPTESLRKFPPSVHVAAVPGSYSQLQVSWETPQGYYTNGKVMGYLIYGCRTENMIASNQNCTGRSLIILYKYRLLMRGMVENYCPRGEIQPQPTIHRGPQG